MNYGIGLMQTAVQRILTPLLTRYRVQKYDKYNQIRKWQWNTEDKADRIQRDRLESLLNHSYEQVPYYRDLLPKSDVIDERGAIHLENFETLPLMDKPTLRKDFEALQSDDLSDRDWYENTSGGSTGEPVRFVQDSEYDQWNFAVKKVFNDWTGYHHVGPEVKLWGSEDDIHDKSSTDDRLHLLDRFRLLVGGRRTQNAFHMTETDMEEYVSELNRIRPVQIKAYTESIYQLSKFIEREGLEVHSPNSILVTAGNLHTHMREQIEHTFRSEVFDQYGSREVGTVACECEKHEGLHVCSPTHLVEILDQQGNPVEPGEVGEIVITTLTNYSMPLIRYRIGDRAAWAESDCSCGRSWPLLEEITGRVSDTFLTKDGTQVHGEYFTHLFYFRDGIQKFQVVQEEYDYIRISIVPVEYTAKANYHQIYREDLNEVTEDIREVMGEECNVVFEFVDHISPTDSGKYRYTISKVAA